MADDRLPCRDNYTDLETQLQALTSQITLIYQTMANLGLMTITPISQADYDNLSQAEKLAGVFDIYDAPEPSIDVSKIVFDDELKSPSPYQTGCECVYIKRGKVVTYFAKITKPLASWTIFNYMPSPYGTPTEAIIGMCEVSGTFYPIILTNNGQFQVRTTPFNDTIYVSGSYLANE